MRLSNHATTLVDFGPCGMFHPALNEIIRPSQPYNCSLFSAPLMSCLSEQGIFPKNAIELIEGYAFDCNFSHFKKKCINAEIILCNNKKRKDSKLFSKFLSVGLETTLPFALDYFGIIGLQLCTINSHEMKRGEWLFDIYQKFYFSLLLPNNMPAIKRIFDACAYFRLVRRYKNQIHQIWNKILSMDSNFLFEIFNNKNGKKFLPFWFFINANEKIKELIERRISLKFSQDQNSPPLSFHHYHPPSGNLSNLLFNLKIGKKNSHSHLYFPLPIPSFEEAWKIVENHYLTLDDRSLLFKILESEPTFLRDNKSIKNKKLTLEQVIVEKLEEKELIRHLPRFKKSFSSPLKLVPLNAKYSIKNSFKRLNLVLSEQGNFLLIQGPPLKERERENIKEAEKSQKSSFPIENVEKIPLVNPSSFDSIPASSFTSFVTLPMPIPIPASKNRIKSKSSGMKRFKNSKKEINYQIKETEKRKFDDSIIKVENKYLITLRGYSLCIQLLNERGENGENLSFSSFNSSSLSSRSKSKSPISFPTDSMDSNIKFYLQRVNCPNVHSLELDKWYNVSDNNILIAKFYPLIKENEKNKENGKATKEKEKGKMDKTEFPMPLRIYVPDLVYSGSDSDNNIEAFKADRRGFYMIQTISIPSSNSIFILIESKGQDGIIGFNPWLLDEFV